ncbi:MAG: patatin-like phospholipase family protein [Bacilli bacterium]|nr:patatin-like phospholipase family protein [Bacilli bacterium]
MKALVFSGGGAKGAYQMGVWKALKKLNMKFDIVTGTSIGAINGMMYVQNNYYKCLKLWNSIDFAALYDNFEVKEDKDILKNYADKIIKGGIDTKKIEKIIYNVYNPTKLYNSKMGYGIVTYNLTDKEVLYATKKNTNPKKMKEYILASATCFPVFKPTTVGKDKFIDGGYYDNLPINLAIELGAKEVLAIDLEAIGIVKRVNDENIKIEYIRPTSKLESILMFEKKAIKRMINLGYNDTMKYFKKLDGKVYTFKKGTINKLYNLYKEKIVDISKKYDINIKEFNKLSQMRKLIEDAFELFEIPVDKIYNYKEVIQILNKSINNVEEVKIDSYEDILKVFDKKILIKYIYTKMNNNDKINYNIFNLLYKELNTAIFLQAIKR